MTDSNINNENRPMKGIETLHDHDVPMGRGGFVNSHRGHRRYLQMVQDRQLEYIQCKKADKMEVAWNIVRQLRALDPPARFLRKDPETGLWSDVGDKKFREKVSQALREHQPFIKAVIECEENQDTSIERSNNNADTSCTNNTGLYRNIEELNTDNAASDDCCFAIQKPSLLVAEERRRAFLTSRNETSELHQEDGPLNKAEDVGFNLSEFTVSQGPSFPSIPAHHDSAPLRRSSSGFLSIFEEIMNRSIDFDGLNSVLNESNDGLSFNGAELTAGLSSEKIAIEDDHFSSLKKTLHADQCFPATMKRTSVGNDDTDDGVMRNNDGPVVKRCTLSRDKSEVSKQLKEKYCTASPAERVFDFEGGEEQGIDNLLCALEKTFPFPNHF